MSWSVPIVAAAGADGIGYIMAVVHPWPAEMFTPYGTLHRLLLVLTVIGAGLSILAGRGRSR